MKYKGLKVLFSCIALYAIQFLIIPLIYKKVYDGGNEAIVAIASTTVLITGVGMFCFSDKIRIWILGMFAYIGLTILYTPPGVYGIGLTGLPLYGISRNYDPAERFFMIAVIVGFVIVLQFSTCCAVKAIKAIRARKQSFKERSMYKVNNDLFKSVIAMAVLYFIQFLAIPIVPISTEEHVFYVSTAIFVVVSFLTLHDKLRFWLLSNLIYAMLIFLYHPPGAYGIGATALGFPMIDESGGTGSGYHREDAWLEITIMTIMLVVVEVLVWCVVKAVKAIRARKQ